MKRVYLLSDNPCEISLREHALTSGLCAMVTAKPVAPVFRNITSSGA